MACGHLLCSPITSKLRALAFMATTFINSCGFHYCLYKSGFSAKLIVQIVGELVIRWNGFFLKVNRYNFITHEILFQCGSFSTLDSICNQISNQTLEQVSFWVTKIRALHCSKYYCSKSAKNYIRQGCYLGGKCHQINCFARQRALIEVSFFGLHFPPRFY